MDYDECLKYTFDPMIKHLIKLIREKDSKKFENLTLKKLVFSKGIFVDGEKLPDEPQDFTFRLVDIIKNRKENWTFLDEKQKCEKFYELFLQKIQNVPAKKKKNLIEILDCIVQEKKINEHAVVKNGELVDVSGVNFDEECFEKHVLSDKGKIIWKKNNRTTLIYSYV